MDRIVHDNRPVMLVGGAHTTPDDLHKALTMATLCVAADGGAERLLKDGIIPDAVIGDFDSLSKAAQDRIPVDRLHEIKEQDSTDFEKALSRIDAPVVIGLGFSGGRIDHQLAVLHGLVVQAHKPCVLLNSEELVFLAPPLIDVPCRAGDVVSLFPLGRVRGHSKGLEWPIDGLEFDPVRQIGTSNRALGHITLGFDAPGMVTVLPARLIQPVVAALGARHAERWPAP